VPPSPDPDETPDETLLMADPRFREAVGLFNAGQWYAAHDGFEELWHETAGPLRSILQGILQLAVAQLHLERGNLRGATILTGEGLGRLRSAPERALGLDLAALRLSAGAWLQVLQQQEHAAPGELPPPRLHPAEPPVHSDGNAADR
jgi:predicted metal-dependent hydrolase